LVNFELVFLVDFQEKEEDGRTSEEDRDENHDGNENGLDHSDEGTEHKLHNQNIQVSYSGFFQGFGILRLSI